MNTCIRHGALLIALVLGASQAAHSTAISPITFPASASGDVDIAVGAFPRRAFIDEILVQEGSESTTGEVAFAFASIEVEPAFAAIELGVEVVAPPGPVSEALATAELDLVVSGDEFEALVFDVDYDLGAFNDNVSGQDAFVELMVDLTVIELGETLSVLRTASSTIAGGFDVDEDSTFFRFDNAFENDASGFDELSISISASLFTSAVALDAVQPVPEPATAWLATPLLAWFAARRRRFG